MYSKFNYKLSDDFYKKYLDKHYQIGNEMYESYIHKSHNCLKNFISDNGRIDATALKEYWFNVVKADVFLSHSHKDLDKVKAFAGWLFDNFGLKSFIDSCVWGYSDDLLAIIDNTYCKFSDGKTYNYSLRNYSTSHVHTMLASALSEMIDKTECIIFINTPNSLVLSDEIDNIKTNRKECTDSPWIYHELSMTGMIRKTQPTRHAISHSAMESFQESNNNSMPGFDYKVEKYLKAMNSLNENILLQWMKLHNKNIKGASTLDELYKICSKSNESPNGGYRTNNNNY